MSDVAVSGEAARVEEILGEREPAQRVLFLAQRGRLLQPARPEFEQDIVQVIREIDDVRQLDLRPADSGLLGQLAVGGFFPGFARLDLAADQVVQSLLRVFSPQAHQPFAPVRRQHADHVDFFHGASSVYEESR